MYSHEIDRLIKIKHNILTISEYCEIVSSSPQIDNVKYEDGMFKLHTEDNYEFKIKLKTYIKHD